MNEKQKAKTEVAARVEALLVRMSLEEKIGQLNQVGGADFAPGPKAEDQIRKGGAGSVLWLNDTKKFNELQKIAIEESPSGIPLLFALDVIHGYRTIFPVPLAMAASWDPTVPEKSQTVAAKEARAAGLHWTFGPMLDIARDARWGRIVEGAGEDPYLGSAMAAAQVRGFQGDDLADPERVLACAKHFAGYGDSDGGRDYDPVYLSETQLRNTYPAAFQSRRRGRRGHLHERLHGSERCPGQRQPLPAASGLARGMGLRRLCGLRRLRGWQHGHPGSCPRPARCRPARPQSWHEHGHVQLHLHRERRRAGGRWRC